MMTPINFACSIDFAFFCFFFFVFRRHQGMFRLLFFLFWHCVYHTVTGIHFALHLRCRKEETQNLSIIVCHECNLTLEATNLIFFFFCFAFVCWAAAYLPNETFTSILRQHSSRKPQLFHNDARAEPQTTTSSHHTKFYSILICKRWLHQIILRPSHRLQSLSAINFMWKILNHTRPKCYVDGKCSLPFLW